MHYYVIICVICAMLGFMVGYIAARDYYIKTLEREREKYAKELREAEYAFQKGLRDIRRIYNTYPKENGTEPVQAPNVEDLSDGALD